MEVFILLILLEIVCILVLFSILEVFFSYVFIITFVRVVLVFFLGMIYNSCAVLCPQYYILSHCFQLIFFPFCCTQEDYSQLLSPVHWSYLSNILFFPLLFLLQSPMDIVTILFTLFASLYSFWHQILFLFLLLFLLLHLIPLVFPVWLFYPVVFCSIF